MAALGQQVSACMSCARRIELDAIPDDIWLALTRLISRQTSHHAHCVQDCIPSGCQLCVVARSQLQLFWHGLQALQGWRPELWQERRRTTRALLAMHLAPSATKAPAGGQAAGEAAPLDSRAPRGAAQECRWTTASARTAVSVVWMVSMYLCSGHSRAWSFVIPTRGCTTAPAILDMRIKPQSHSTKQTIMPPQAAAVASRKAAVHRGRGPPPLRCRAAPRVMCRATRPPEGALVRTRAQASRPDSSDESHACSRPHGECQCVHTPHF